jgi:ribulose-phosphate 3-epimerase
MKFYPAILTENIDITQHELDLAIGFSDCDIVQVDLIDGYFADALTITPADLATCEFGSLQCDLHIMAIDPEDVVHEAIEFASQLPIRAVIGQVEKMSSEQSFIDVVTRQGWRAGLSLDVDTAIESIDETIWPELHLLQVMSVPAGEQGQPFAPRTMELVKAVEQLRQQRGLQFELLVDGGIRPNLVSKLVDLHVDGCMLGSYLWQNPVPADALHTISQ